MTDDEWQLRLAVGTVGPLCNGCAVRKECGAAELEEACRRDWGEPKRGGVNVVHPSDPETWDYLHEVGGVGFEDIVARPQPPIVLPPFADRIRPRRALRGQLSNALYLIGPKAVVRSQPLICQQVRTMTGLARDQDVGLILFGTDRVLEDLWTERFLLIGPIAAAGYAFCVPPSYSNYTDRPRTQFLYNIKRSLEFFQLLQIHGVPTMPRLAWLIEHDVRRCADWIEANPVVEMVALDLAGSSPRGWQRELRLLASFDSRTGRRLSYLIHGPGVEHRFFDLYRLLGMDRVHLTNSRAIAKPPPGGSSGRGRFESERAKVDNARRIMGGEGLDAEAA